MLVIFLLLPMNLCWATDVPLGTRDIAPTTDATAVIADLNSKYSSAAYSEDCLTRDCPGFERNGQYCAATCKGDVTQTTTLFDALGTCISKSPCGVQATVQLKPFNISISINSRSCYLSATTPKVQLNSNGNVLQTTADKYEYKTIHKMSFVWSGLNLQCGNPPSTTAPAPSVRSLGVPSYFLSIFCTFMKMFPFNHFFVWWICPSNPPPNRNGFSGPLQFTQNLNVSQLDTFAPSSGKLTVQITDTGTAPTKTYSFNFGAGIPAANQPAIQAAIQNVFNNGDPSGTEASIIKALYKSIISIFINDFCSLTSTAECS